MIYIQDLGDSFNRRSLITLFLGKRPKTFSNPECTELQCEEGRYRSITELYEIVRTYYPVTSLEAVLRIIRDIISGDSQIGMVWCTQVNKVVLKYGVPKTALESELITKYSKANYYTKKGVDGYSLKDYETIIKNLK